MDTAIRDPIDISRAIGLTEAAKLMRGRGGKSPSVETIRRWANPKKGCWPAGKEGPQLLLRTVRYNGELVTLPEWVQEFERLRVALGLREPLPPSERPRPMRSRMAAHRRAEEALDRMGEEIKRK